MASHHIVTLPGDGIGPEILAAATRVLDAVGSFTYEEHRFGGAAIDTHGVALTDDTVAACRAAGAVLLAAVPVAWLALRPDLPVLTARVVADNPWPHRIAAVGLLVLAVGVLRAERTDPEEARE
jgi:isocitrate/isopropylmalate dehydrogenase